MESILIVAVQKLVFTIDIEMNALNVQKIQPISRSIQIVSAEIKMQHIINSEIDVMFVRRVAPEQYQTALATMEQV